MKKFLFIFLPFLLFIPLFPQKTNEETFLVLYQKRGQTEKIRLDSEWKARAKVKELRKNPEVSNIEFGRPFRILITPNDTFYSNQWALPKISAPSAWEITTGSSSTIVAVIDTGIDGTHPDLTGRVIAGRNFVADPDQDISAGTNSDDNGHGTAVAGIIGANTNNATGTAGVDWQAKLMPLKAMDAAGEGDPDWVAAAITYAADNGAKIINLSIGSPTDYSLVRNAVNYAYSKNSLLVGASGNDGTYGLSYPARYSNVTAVGSSNSSDFRSSFSNYGPELDVVAPGENIYTTYWISGQANQYTSSFSGTSASTPFVSGLASLIWAKYPSFSNSQIQEKIIKNTDMVGGMGTNIFTNVYGYGRINTLQSLCRLIKGLGPEVYLLDRGYKYHIPNPTTFDNFNFTWGEVNYPYQALIENTSYGGALNNLVKGNTSEIYALDQGVKRHIIDMPSFLNFGFKWGTISFLSDNFIYNLPSSTFLSRLTKGSGEAVYLIENGKRRWVSSLEVFYKNGYRWEFVGRISDGLLYSKPEGPPVK